MKIIMELYANGVFCQEASHSLILANELHNLRGKVRLPSAGSDLDIILISNQNHPKSIRFEALDPHFYAPKCHCKAPETP